MTFRSTLIQGLFMLSNEKKGDERGWLMRLADSEVLKEHYISFPMKQLNLTSTAQKHTLRGMHFQKHPKEEGKIVQCIKGSIFDVVIDLRKNSPTYRQYVGQELSEKNHDAFLIPKGCAHGFVTLTDACLVHYTMSALYEPEYASGVRWNDPAFGIHWPVQNPTMNERDATWPLLNV